MGTVEPCRSQVNSTIHLAFPSVLFWPSDVLFFLLPPPPPTQSERPKLHSTSAALPLPLPRSLVFFPTTNSHPNGQPLIIVNKRWAASSRGRRGSIVPFIRTRGCVDYNAALRQTVTGLRVPCCTGWSIRLHTTFC